MRWLPSVCTILCREEGKIPKWATQGRSPLEGKCVSQLLLCVSNGSPGLVCLSPAMTLARDTHVQFCTPTAVFLDQRSKRKKNFLKIYSISRPKHLPASCPPVLSFQVTWDGGWFWWSNSHNNHRIKITICGEGITSPKLWVGISKGWSSSMF